MLVGGLAVLCAWVVVHNIGWCACVSLVRVHEGCSAGMRRDAMAGALPSTILPLLVIHCGAAEGKSRRSAYRALFVHVDLALLAQVFYNGDVVVVGGDVEACELQGATRGSPGVDPIGIGSLGNQPVSICLVQLSRKGIN